jgi:HAD superfamily hydrolase (TIGR01549 family)
VKAVAKAGYQGVVFDMDGTLTLPTLDFARMRRELGLGPGDLAQQILALSASRQAEAWAVVERHEEAARRTQSLQEGVPELLGRCRSAGVRLGIVTRNTRRSVHALCERFGLTFDAVVTREFPHIKPHPGPVLHILQGWAMRPERALVVGDYVHDIESGRAAGCRTCLFRNPGGADHDAGADFTVRSMRELERLMFGGNTVVNPENSE